MQYFFFSWLHWRLAQNNLLDFIVSLDEDINVKRIEEFEVRKELLELEETNFLN